MDIGHSLGVPGSGFRVQDSEIDIGHWTLDIGHWTFPRGSGFRLVLTVIDVLGEKRCLLVLESIIFAESQKGY